MRIGIIGAGKIGGSIAALLETCGFCQEVRLADNRPLDSLQTLPKSSNPPRPVQISNDHTST